MQSVLWFMVGTMVGSVVTLIVFGEDEE